MMLEIQKLNRAATVVVLLGVVLLLLALGQVTVWALDRRAPFEMVSYEPRPTRAGEAAIFRAVVKRDVSRSCSSSYSRLFYDSTGSRFDVTTGEQIMSADALSDLARRSPAAMVLSVVIPPAAAPGPGALVTVVNYVCNPLHQIFPVTVLLVMDVEVLSGT